MESLPGRIIQKPGPTSRVGSSHSHATEIDFSVVQMSAELGQLSKLKDATEYIGKPLPSNEVACLYAHVIILVVMINARSWGTSSHRTVRPNGSSCRSDLYAFEERILLPFVFVEVPLNKSAILSI